MLTSCVRLSALSPHLCFLTPAGINQHLSRLAGANSLRLASAVGPTTPSRYDTAALSAAVALPTWPPGTSECQLQKAAANHPVSTRQLALEPMLVLGVVCSCVLRADLGFLQIPGFVLTEW